MSTATVGSSYGAGIFLAFTHALRAAGLAVSPDRGQSFLDAVSRLDAGERRHVYWAGRSTLCAGPDDFAVYDQTFERWFNADPPGRSVPAPVARSAPQAELAREEGTDEGEDRLVAVLASAEEALRHRDVATLSAAERQHLAQVFSSLRLDIPLRRSLRKRPHRHGEIDSARTIRDQLRRAGEPGPLRYRRPQRRPRRIVMLIDISGSMEAYADSLLRLAHRVVLASPYRAEVFTLGTRLTRVTTAMRIKDPEQALRVAGNTVPDWSGGTRLGEALRAFNERWGQRGLARGAVVVIASDGWERGDPELLGEQVQRLQRLAHLVLWSNPHRGKAGYEPIQGGIAAALPYVDKLVAGHSVAAFTDLLELISDA
ncbi:MAG: vWA domain-containing protein [Aeromicrobium sp.]